MGFAGFLSFGLKYIQLLAWPSLALGYPLCASIQAIETNSKYQMQKLVTYWILFSLISLFEHACGNIIDWLSFWPYMKILAVCWLVIPDFGGAYEAYKSLVRPCFSLQLLEVVINLFNKNQELFLKGETFLAAAERYVDDNGTEALEQLIAKKGAMQNIDVEETKSIEVGKNMDAATLVQLKSTDPIVIQKDIKAVEVLEEIAAATENNVKNVSTLISQTENKTNNAVEVKNMILPETRENELSDSFASDYVQKEWTCAVCQLTLQSETTLNSHLQGRRHKAKCEELKANKPAWTNKNPSSTTRNKLDSSRQDTKESVSNGELDKVWICDICQVTAHSEELLNFHLHGAKHWAKCEELKASKKMAKTNNCSSSTSESNQANQDPTRALSRSGSNKQWGCVLCQVTLQSKATRDSHFKGLRHRSNCEQLKASKMTTKNNNSSALNKLEDQNTNLSADGLKKTTNKVTEEVKIKASVKSHKYWCSVCNVTCSSKIDMDSHLKGRRHLSGGQTFV